MTVAYSDSLLLVIGEQEREVMDVPAMSRHTAFPLIPKTPKPDPMLITPVILGRQGRTTRVTVRPPSVTLTAYRDHLPVPFTAPALPEEPERMPLPDTDTVVEEAPQPFLPWVVPAALLMLLGIVLAWLALPWWAVVIWAVALGVPLGLRRRYLLLIILLFIPLGYGRYSMWNARPNPFNDLLSQGEVVLSGVSDGRFFKPDERDARIALSPQGVVGEGRATVRLNLFLPQGKRNPGGFDYQGYLARRNIWAQGFVREVIVFEPTRPSFRTQLQHGLIHGLSQRSAALMQAMTLGIRDDLGDLREIFARSGLAHILALSGLHVGILVAALGYLLRFSGPLRYPTLIAATLGFMLIVGPTPSIVRAVIMTVSVLCSLWLGSGRLHISASLALAALISLLWNPSLVFDLSFQLSYLAVLGILAFAQPLTERILGCELQGVAWWDWRQFVVASMIVSLSAQALSLPLVMSTFGSLPLLSPLVNVVAVPLATLLVPLGFLAAVLGVVAVPLARLVNVITEPLSWLLLKIADQGAVLPTLYWGEIAPIGYGYYALAIMALLMWVRRYLTMWRMLLVVSVAVLCSMVSVTTHRPPEIVFLDVGQGDSVLVRLPGRVEILIDGGGSPFSDFDVGARTVVPALRALGVDELELMIASHPDTDHIEGLVSVLQLIPTQQLVIGHPKEGKPLFDALMQAAHLHSTSVTQVRRGQQLTLPGAHLTFLNPPHRLYAEDNDNSVVFVMDIEGKTKTTKALFLGDVSEDVERELAFPKVDILLAGHHGSPHSSSAELLQAAQPETAVLSYGRNYYGHPAPEVLERLRSQDIEILATHEHGAVRIPLP